MVPFKLFLMRYHTFIPVSLQLLKIVSKVFILNTHKRFHYILFNFIQVVKSHSLYWYLQFACSKMYIWCFVKVSYIKLCWSVSFVIANVIVTLYSSSHYSISLNNPKWECVCRCTVKFLLTCYQITSRLRYKLLL